MKKLLIAPLCAVIVIAGVATFAAFEAHVINVTAHIENALAVSPADKEVKFGTVFPQEYIDDRTITVELSPSFKDSGQDRVDTVDYKIVQKPKPIPGEAETTLTVEAAKDQPVIKVAGTTNMSNGDELVIGYHNNMERGIIESIATLEITLESNLTLTHASGETVIEVYPDLCRFLSKMKVDTDTDTDTEVPSYLTRDGSGNPLTCAIPNPDIALGNLTKSSDEVDEWIIDLNVPPVDGSIGQDWPDSCADWTVPAEADYGCDLWIEVIGIN